MGKAFKEILGFHSLVSYLNLPLDCFLSYSNVSAEDLVKKKPDR